MVWLKELFSDLGELFSGIVSVIPNFHKGIGELLGRIPKG